MTELSNADSPWPHRLAVLVACATFPLIWVGGLVTTYDAGMAVPDWPSTYGYNLFLYPWQTWIGGPWDLFIEHGHRLLASFVGLLTLALAAVVWRFESRNWVRWFSLACVVGVISQGVIGGMRVLLNERVIAKVHGCVGPLFFCLVIGMVVATSRKWRDAKPLPQSSGRAAALAWLATVLAFTQIVVGAQLRHITAGTTNSFFKVAVIFHIAIAFALLLHVVLLAVKVLRQRSLQQDRLAMFLVALVTTQILLGASSWIVKYGPPTFLGEWMIGYTIGAETLMQSLIVTGHVATGSLILVTCLSIALSTTRLCWVSHAVALQTSSPVLSANRPNASMRLEAIG